LLGKNKFYLLWDAFRKPKGMKPQYICFHALTEHPHTMAPRILAYSATAGFRHDSIEASIEALKAKESALDVKFDFTEDRSKFTDENLSQYDAILFLNNSGIGTAYILE
jgi:hypothetical protein